MDELNGQRLPSELAELEQRLRQGRAQASELELDELKLRSMSQARRAKPVTGPGGFMKSRFALLAMIVVGLMMSTTGVGLAVSGSSLQGNAAGVVYGQVQGQDEGGNSPAQTVGGDKGTGSNGSAPTNAQEVKQATASNGNGTLPFTGLLAVPLLLGGVALLGTGVVLRRRATE
jgi:hypothetical protein